MSRQEIARPAGYAPGVGALLSMMEDCRSRTLGEVDRVFPQSIDTPTTWSGNSVGSLLYHIAAIELDWLFADILEEEFPEDTAQWFPHDVREESGRLTPVGGDDLDRHRARLAWVRGYTRAALATLSDDDLGMDRPAGDDGSVTVEWILHHLLQHEAEHRGQLAEIRTSLQS
ncbi:MAG: hypothetical protein A2Z12_01725 [Actinobacteria bacterium RBG_16_68_21]|nr:MAG: hypothetical protein A2Z12_01725 [Actinobacteria bacterium RBG_16_68_21]